ncbi:peptidoglycan-binding protein [Streptomyces sp. NPDC051987]|uniref:peptidoglycan-binding protein n=1 Tax=Streptomyces sp. NPDC051987 TaxID=3155808 RepID=UPI00343B693D
MPAPVFEEFDPASTCACPGCVHWRRVGPSPLPGRFGGHPAARGVLVVAAAASAALAASTPTAAAYGAPPVPHRSAVPVDPAPETPQGTKSPLHGPNGASVQGPVTTPPITRTQIINRAKTWVGAQVPYSMSLYWTDGYRQDCSGYVSMAWGLTGNEWTGTLGQFATRITKDELQPGDILLFHNPDNPEKGSHVVIFGGWTDYTHTSYTAYEQTPPRARRQTTPYAYWTDSAKYLPYRYNGLIADPGTLGAPAGRTAVPFPGAAYFGPGADNKYVTLLGQLLVARGAGSHYAKGPGPVWGPSDQRATQAFQRAQGWTGAAADGLPGPRTWELLATGKGRNVKPAGTAPPAPASHGVPGYPGRNYFRPGTANDHITELGRQLIKKGYGRFYPDGPHPAWGEADRRAVEAFQRAQGWRGGAADGYPGPETWRRLFL